MKEVLITACCNCWDITGCWVDGAKTECHWCPDCILCVTRLDEYLSHGICSRCICDIREQIRSNKNNGRR